MNPKTEYSERTMTKNNLLSERLNYIGASDTPTHLHLYSYNAEGVSTYNGKDIDDLSPYLRKDAVNWIQIHGLQNTDAVRHICQFFGIDFLTMQDILNSTHLTKIEEHETYNTIILKLLRASGDTYLPQQVTIIQGGNFVLTFMERENDFFGDIGAALEENVLKIRNRQSDFLLSVMLNSVMARFMSVISDFEDGLEDLEESLLADDPKEIPDIEHIRQYRRNYRLLRKCIMPFKEEIVKLLHADNVLLHKANRPFFNDVNDHLKFVLQTLEGCRDMISALIDLYVSNNDRRMNSIMKQLTIVSTIFIPLTFLAGIWGMNFRWMPELEWKYGYLFAWILMLLLVVFIYFYFKRKKWY